MSENERYETFLLVGLDFKSLSRHIFLKSKMVITSYKLGYLILIIYTMMSLFSTSSWIPLSLIPLMGLLSSSLL